MNLNILFDNEHLIELHKQQKNLIKYLLLDELSINDQKVGDCIKNLVFFGEKLGLHYGHSTSLRKCASAFLNGSKYQLSTINLHYSYISLCKLAMKIKTTMAANKNIYICTNGVINSEYANLIVGGRWVPGSITNRRYVERKNRTKFYLIISTKCAAYAVLSRETCIYNETMEDKISLISIVDTDINTVDATSQHTLICMNNDSPFFSQVINGFIELCLGYKALDLTTQIPNKDDNSKEA